MEQPLAVTTAGADGLTRQRPSEHYAGSTLVRGTWARSPLVAEPLLRAIHS